MSVIVVYSRLPLRVGLDRLQRQQGCHLRYFHLTCFHCLSTMGANLGLSSNANWVDMHRPVAARESCLEQTFLLRTVESSGRGLCDNESR